MFDGFLSEAAGVVIIAGIGLAFIQHKNLVMKLVGALFCALALVQALQSPSLLAVLTLMGGLYIAFLIVKAVLKARKGKKCARCEHANHGYGPCANTHCTCPR